MSDPKCQVSTCSDRATDTLTYLRDAEGDPCAFEIRFCPKHAEGLRQLAEVIRVAPEIQPPPISVACETDGCMEAAAIKLCDDAGTPVGFYCKPHGTRLLVAMTGAPPCAEPGCEDAGDALSILVNDAGNEIVFYCATHAVAAEKAAKAAGAHEVKVAQGGERDPPR